MPKSAPKAAAKPAPTKVPAKDPAKPAAGKSGKGDHVFLVDGSSYIFRAYHALPPLMSPKGEPSHAVLGVTTMIRKLLADKKPQLFAAAMDSRACGVRLKPRAARRDVTARQSS